jgi:hypothetical protein
VPETKCEADDTHDLFQSSVRLHYDADQAQRLGVI